MAAEIPNVHPDVLITVSIIYRVYSLFVRGDVIARCADVSRSYQPAARHLLTHISPTQTQNT